MKRIRAHNVISGTDYWCAPGSIFDVITETSTAWIIQPHPNQGKVEVPKSEATVVTGFLSVQVGGEHYKSLAIQPAEYTTRNGIGHLAGDAIAYITRYKAKNGRQDLEKAIHSLQLLIELEYPEK